MKKTLLLFLGLFVLLFTTPMIAGSTPSDDGKCGQGKCSSGKCGQGKCASGKCGGK